MKTMNIDQTNLADCVNAAQGGRVVVMRDGVPAALVLGLDGLDREEIELGLSDRFWRIIAERRRESTLSREELERRISGPSPER